MNAINPYQNSMLNGVDVTNRPQAQPQSTHDQRTDNSSPNSKYRDTVTISYQAQQKIADEQLAVTSTDPLNQYRYGDLTTYDNLSFLEKVNPTLLDQRTGLDREKIEEINDKMEAIINDDSIPAEEKEELLKQLAVEKEEEYNKAAEKMTDQAKSEIQEDQTSKLT